MKNRYIIRDISLMAFMLALLIISSKITFAVGPIPFTLQTLVVILIGYILKTKKALIVTSIYVVIGVIGLPVFSTGGGFMYVMTPSFGFILGFIISTIFSGQKKFKGTFAGVFSGLLSLLVIDIIGIGYMYLIMNYYLDLNQSIIYILQAGLFPFIIKDVISVVMAYLMYRRVEDVKSIRSTSISTMKRS